MSSIWHSPRTCSFKGFICEFFGGPGEDSTYVDLVLPSPFIGIPLPPATHGSTVHALCVHYL